MRIRGYAPATPCWAELHTDDPAAAGEFYAGMFGWHQASGATPGGFRLRELAAAGLAPGAPNGWLSYLSTDDIEQTAALVVDAGGRVLREPEPVGTVARRAIFTDPQGAVFGGWQRLSFAGAQVANEPGATCWTELATTDRNTATVFYGKVFGWRERTDGYGVEPGYGEWLTPSEAAVAGVLTLDAGGRPHWRTAFQVDDLAAAIDRCRGLGGRVDGGPTDVLAGRAAQLVDPGGARFSIVELTGGLPG